MAIDSIKGYDPLADDSMDPNDPSSILYDPDYANKTGTAVIIGQNVVPIATADPNQASADQTAADKAKDRSDASYLRPLRNQHKYI